VKGLKLIRFFQHSLYRIFGKRIGDYPPPPVEGLEEIGFFDKKRQIHTESEFEEYFKNSPVYRGGRFTPIKPGMISLVKDSNRVLVKKSYEGIRKQSEFYNELVCLNRLSEIDGVPDIRYVDYKSLSIYMDYIDGVTVSWKRPSQELILNPDNIDLLREEFTALLSSVHNAGILLYDFKGSNMIWSNSFPWFIDYGDSLYFRKKIPTVVDAVRTRELEKLKTELNRYTDAELYQAQY
jgi:hypothetical protein